MKTHTLDHTDIKRLDNLIVTCRFDQNGEAMVDRIEILHEMASFEQDVTALFSQDESFMDELKSRLEDWHNGFLFEQMNAKKEYENDDEVGARLWG